MPRLPLRAVAAAASVLALAAGCGAEQAAEPDPAAPPAGTLPRAEHYHSLLVDGRDADRLLLGTHGALYESLDGGRTWRPAGLEGEDVMGLARTKDGTVWAAGHGLFARSTDGGRTWSDVRPEGLPGLDVHAIAASIDVGGRLYVAIAGRGMYRSRDGGASFHLLSQRVGPDVHALTETKDGVLVAADGERGIVVNAEGDGVEWLPARGEPTASVAASWLDPPGRRILASGRSLELGDTSFRWKEVLAVDAGVGPVAWSASEPDVAYAVAFDGTLYRSDDGGESWAPVR